jgi:hypothetical protein
MHNHGAPRQNTRRRDQANGDSEQRRCGTGALAMYGEEMTEATTMSIVLRTIR